MSKIAGIYVEIKGDSAQLKKDLADAKAYAAQQAKGISNALNNALSTDQLNYSFKKLIENLSDLNRASKLTGNEFKHIGVDLGELRRVTGLTDAQFSTLQSRMLQTRAAKNQESALKDIASAAGLTKEEIRALGAQMNVSEANIEKVTAALHGARNAVTSTVNSYSILRRAGETALGVLGAQTALEAAFRIKEFAADVLETGMNLESLTLSFNAIFESADLAAEQMNRVRQIGAQYGQNFYVIADGYKQMTAAAKGSNLEGATTEKLFRGISAAGTVLGMSNERVALSIKAFTDMISKGQIQMEEVKNQLGDNLPGAVRLFADAMGIGTDELLAMAKEGQLFAEDVLPKVADALDNAYGKAAKTAALETGRAAVNRLSQEWTDLKANLYDSDSAVAGINAVANALRGMNELVTGIKTGKNSYGQVRFIWDGLGKGEDVSTNSVRQSVNRSSIKSKSFTGNWAEIEAATSQMSVGQSQQVQDAQEKITKEIERGRKALESYIQTERERAKASYDDAVKYAQTEAERSKALATYQSALAAIDKRDSKKSGRSGTDEAARAVASLQSEIAKLSMTEADFERYQLSEQFDKYAASIGRANPLLAQWVALREKDITTKAVENELEDYFSEIDDAYADQIKKADDAKEKNLALVTEFADKYKEIVVGEREFKIHQIEAEAEAYRKAGVDEIALAQYVAQQKLQYATDWESGAKRAWQSYSESVQTYADLSENMVTDMAKGMEDALVEFCQTGEFSFNSMLQAMAADLARFAASNLVQSLFGGSSSGGSSSWLSSLIGAGASALSSYFTGGASIAAGSASSGFNYSGEMSSFFATHHAGGIVGSEPTAMRAVNPAIFSGAPRFHTGGIAGDEIPIIARRGEGVFTPGQMQAMGGSDSETKALLREIAAGIKQQKGNRIINAFDDSTVANAMDSAAGEKIVLNHIRRNKAAIKAALQ